MKQLIYNKLPYFLKYILVNIKAFLNRKKRYNKFYLSTYNDLMSNYNSSYEEVLQFQNKRLKGLLLECYDYTVYYKGIFDKLNLNRQSILDDPYKVLYKMPILTKDVRKTYVEDIINTNSKRKICDITFTSGTTGTPTKNYIDDETNALSFALWDRFHENSGISKRDRSVRLSYNRIISNKTKKNVYWIYNVLDKQLFFSIYHLFDKNLIFYINKLNDYKPIYIDGSPSAIYILANFINLNNFTINFELKAIFTTAETLFAYQRLEIEKAFRCKVYNQYASSEGSPFITECKNGNLHLEEDSGVFEILDEENNNIEKGLGKLVVTSLRNFKTPLIRYDILDYVEIDTSNNVCNCGSPFRIIKSIEGRANDLFWCKKKGFTRANVSSVLVNFSDIKKMQIIQINPYTLNVKTNINNQESFQYEIFERKLTTNLEETISEDVTVNFEYNTLEIDANNKKNRFIIRDFDVNDFKYSN